ncbi:bifunctional (p)ppGpp synthetase/guanosine-3',5'-bis(diphosphate) 3'-pyrophosphohydrolase [Kingella kingae]|uniref:Guanosine 3',5'-bis(Diphosphate) 3'-pyrophosphohydrolase n=4 Tax=Kingella kingae TaxID=504 RepID=F5S5V3_KINKI|nr:bifunctional (p)ppGpp synthetase/guanosine-3',5'-bis(diphosphate) 3'-pyrophosphohydrolase [Kingella kingae]EGK10804.1 guanosine 3',5'-bis(diphosphate) 3'-pyrophosphohydrolase [Kingella kingae ATCC 23330]MBD3614392.1 bifunctional (p)ppGpp synthetase/guanosine-3',5'-bis(diphosphate) 3'-pyrophosphohydrolase [Kingella kingae]MBD3632616.1 bifunctional (p)ppGpp synthetase/guanosine-3',5'-bis(diphosphate) 3'-pyrophosphohydrolase [Kingella kingae]MBD3660009.1 bifunctional (p)ppGpp synthetase/guanosi
MSPIQPTAPYDSLTASVRDTLFREARYLNADELQQLEKACAYAFFAHDGQTRKSGEPYITHPIAVTIELARWRMDIQTLSAGLMHDVLEDTHITKAEMAQEFGDTITEMVDGLSKLENLKYDSKAEQQAESFRKLILAMTKDIRIIIVKLSDRLHNMRTLGAKSPDSRRRIATETLEVYAPIANRLGLNPVYRELQDLAFKAMHPARYQVLQRAMTAFKKNRHDVIERVLREMSLHLVGYNIEAKIQGREKNLYNIHQKMKAKKIKFEDVLDIYGFRVIVNSKAACYVALGALHELYQPKPGKFKDYIAIPKSNGYQSLHTALNGPYGLPIEIQIRTREMHAVAESGVASHWAYKSGDTHEDETTLRTNQWLQNILDLQSRSDNAFEFLEHIKVDLFPNEVYIVTPKGKIITLPRGASTIDFAYAIHTDIGNRCIGARVNNVAVPLRTKLKTGDTVEIITSPNGKPNPAWLSFAASSRARSAIRNYVKNTSRSDAIALGERLLAQALGSLLPKEVAQSDTFKDKYLKQLEAREQKLEDVLYNVGVGLTLPVSVAMEIADMAGNHFGGEVKLSPIQIHGSETTRVHLGKCCMPVAGDSVRAVIVKDQGLIIHRDTCATLLKSDPEQQLDADWATLPAGMEKMYDAAVVVSSADAHALLATMASAISGTGGNIASVDTLSKSQAGTEGFIEFRFNVNVRDLAHLKAIMTALQHIPHVRTVKRV